MKSFRDRNPIAVGIVGVTLTGGALAGAFAVGTFDLLADRYEMSAVMSETGGLRSGQDVRLAGVEVGEITSVDPDFGLGQVVVTFEVDRGVDVGAGAGAESANLTLLGGPYLRLTDGGAEEGAALMEDLPPEERRIPIGRTAVSSSVIDALGDATETVQALDVDTINDVIDSLADVTVADEGGVAALVRDLGTLSAALDQRGEEIRGLVDNGQQVAAALAGRDAELAALIDSAGAVLDALASQRDQLSVLLGSGSDAVNRLADLVATTREDLGRLIEDLGATLVVTDRNLATLNTGLAFIGPTFQGLSSAVDNGPWIDAVATGLGPVDADLFAQLLAPLFGLLPPTPAAGGAG